MLDPTTISPESRQVGEWVSLISQQQIALGQSTISALTAILEAWCALPVHHEPTWVQATHGIPNLILRFDMTLDESGEPIVYEIENRSLGIGSAVVFNTQFRQRLERLQSLWPPIISVRSAGHRRFGSDDGLWLDEYDVSSAPNGGHKLLVRALPHEAKELESLQHQAIGPIASEGDKSYGEALGWWRKVTSPEQLDWDTRFVLKPLQGTRTEGVVIWLGPGKQGRVSGASTRSKVERALAEAGAMWCQPYQAPQQLVLPSGKVYNLMLRPYFGYHPIDEQHRTGSWEYLGGEWLLDPSVKLHGTSQTIFGPLV